MSNYGVGLNHVGSYQVSGQPWISGSALPTDASGSLKFSFPIVTKRVLVRSNDELEIRIHFAPYTASFGYVSGAFDNSNFITLSGSGEVDLGVKCKEVFISAPSATGSELVEVYAELTNIPAARMFDLDGLVGVTN